MAQADYPFRAARFGGRDTIHEAHADGIIRMRSPEALQDYPARLTERLSHWARMAPDRVFLAERDTGGEWRSVTYREALQAVEALGEALLERGLGPDRPLAILSDNETEHALLGLAALHVGVPYAPISPAYSLVSSDFAKLRHVLNLVRPGLVYATDGRKYARALTEAVPPEAQIAVRENPPAGRDATLFADLRGTTPTERQAAAHRAVMPDSVAKLLFTSGSTGLPKGVINTQRMLCSNQQMLAQSLPLLCDPAPVIVDWLPWNHTFGGNHNVGLVLYNGGTMHIDHGKPVPGLVEQSIRNLREISPTVYFNVPKGFEMLVHYLADDPGLRETFFRRLQMIFFAGAALPQHVWRALEELAVRTIGERIPIISGLGSTETAPYALAANWPVERSGIIGLPVPGVELKLVPNGRKLEVRVRGPNVTPGYWRQPDLSAKVFDEEGYLCMGDAARFTDPKRPEIGLEFDGRIAEDFKLTSGTWVSVGPLRARFIAHFSPYLRDVVIAGQDRDEIAAILLLDLDNARKLAADLGPQATLAEIARHPGLRKLFAERLKSFQKQATGSASRVMRIAILEEMPSLDAGEVTDKGSINQRAVLEHRAALVADLYAEPSPAHVISALDEEVAHA